MNSGRDIPDPAPPGSPVLQRYTINTLSSIWLPAAYTPTSTPTAPDISYDPASASFITAEATSDGLVYDVTSNISVPTPESLQAETATISHRASSTRCPARRPHLAPRRQHHRGSYDALREGARTLGFFRSGSFVFDLRVPPGHSGDALENFLFNSRRGYCEQFAGSYAVLARLAGLPAHIAVGFTAGESDPSIANRFHVPRGQRARLARGVHRRQRDWVAFEPTPGRGVPGGEGYPRIPEAQANPTQPSTATTASPSAAAPATTAVTAAPTPTAETEDGGPWRTLILVGVTLIAAIAAYAGAVPAAIAFRRRARWRTVAAPIPGQGPAWAETGDTLTAAGQRPPRGRTPAQVASTAAGLVGDPRAADSTASPTPRPVAVYAQPRLGEDDVNRVRTDAEIQMSAAALRTLSNRKRLWRALDPRRLRSQRS